MEFLLQPIRRSNFLEETGDSEVPGGAPQSEKNGPVVEYLQLPPACESADARICDMERGRPAAEEVSPPASELSTGKMNPQTQGWNKRLRIGAAAPSRVPCASRVSAFESAVRGFADNPGEAVIIPKVGTTFDSVGEAYDFYNMYSWEKGFGIRYGKSRLNVERTKCMQEIVCGCSGKAGVENTRSCRCDCPALIRFLRTDDNGWYIAEHRENHNHSLSPNFGETMHWPSHKHIDVYSRDLIKQLRQNNVNLSKVYSIIGSFFGSMENVPFSKRSLRSLCGKLSREQADDDVRKTMEVFAELGPVLKSSNFTKLHKTSFFSWLLAPCSDFLPVRQLNQLLHRYLGLAAVVGLSSTILGRLEPAQDGCRGEFVAILG